MATSDLIDRFSEIPLDVSAVIAIRPLRVSHIIGLRAGDVLPTDVPATARLTVFAGNARIAQGDASHSGGRLTVRLVEIGGAE